MSGETEKSPNTTEQLTRISYHYRRLADMAEVGNYVCSKTMWLAKIQIFEIQQKYWLKITIAII